MWNIVQELKCTLLLNQYFTYQTLNYSEHDLYSVKRWNQRTGHTLDFSLWLWYDFVDSTSNKMVFPYTNPIMLYLHVAVIFIYYYMTISISILVSYSEFHIGLGIILWVPYRSWYHTQNPISVLVSYSEFHIGPGIMLKIPCRSWYHTQSSILTLVSYSEFHIGPRTDAKIAVGNDMLWYIDHIFQNEQTNISKMYWWHIYWFFNNRNNYIKNSISTLFSSCGINFYTFSLNYMRIILFITSSKPLSAMFIFM